MRGARRTYAAVFAAGVLFITFFYQGLPFDFIRDYLDNSLAASRYSASERL